MTQTPDTPRVITIAQRKGGAGKSSLAVGIASELTRRGRRVGVVDVDPNGSSTAWLASVNEVDAVPAPLDRLAALIELRGSLPYDTLLIDTPANSDQAIALAAKLADLVLVPIAPSAIEVHQVGATAGLIPAGVAWRIVPTRVDGRTRSGQAIAELCAAHGLPVTDAAVPLSESVRLAFGRLAPSRPFRAIVDELLGLIGGVS